jgi:hypothetical protein
VGRVGPSSNDRRDCADALRRAVAPFVVLVVSVEFNQHAVIDVRTEGSFDRFKIRAVPSLVSCTRCDRREARSATNSCASAALRDPSITHGTIFVSASIATHSQMSPAPGTLSAIAIVTFFCLQYAKDPPTRATTACC